MQYVSQQLDTFLATTITEEFSEWDVATTYNVDTDTANLTDSSTVRYGNYYYRSVTDLNVGNNPVETLGVHWFLYKVSNPYAMLDLQSTTKTVVDAGSIDATFSRGFSDTIVIGNYVGNSVTVELLDNLDAVLWTKTVTSSPNEDVVDYFTYFYSDYTNQTDRGISFELPFIGTKIRVLITANSGTSTAECGFLIGGIANDMGATLYGVGFRFNSYSVKDVDDFGIINITKRGIQDLVDFETIVENPLVASNIRKTKLIYDDIVAFIVDPTPDSIYDNMITLGTISDVSAVIENNDKTIFAWSVQETI